MKCDHLKNIILLNFFLFSFSSIFAESNSSSQETRSGLLSDNLEGNEAINTNSLDDEFSSVDEEIDALFAADEFEFFDDDFDSMFEDVEDTEIVVEEESKNEPSFLDFKALPVTFTGSLTSDIGLGYIYESTAIIDEYVRRFEQYNYYTSCLNSGTITRDEFVYLMAYHNITNNPDQLFTADELLDFALRKSSVSSQANKLTGYFTFSNTLNINARPSKDFALHGSINITFPGYTWGLSECYFDLIVRNSICFTVGKKATTWGYTRLFSQSTNSTKEYEVGGENTNILSDTGSGTSLMLRIPFWTGTISALAVYTGSSSTPNFDEMFFAGSVELVVKKVSINLFGRKENVETGETLGPLLGLEMKRTIFDADVYGQFLARTDNDEAFEDILKGDADYKNFQQFIFTGGLYRWWDKHDPNFGFNIEYQGACALYTVEEENPYYSYIPGQEQYKEVLQTTINHRIAYDVGVKRLGKNHNIKIGVEGSHDLSDKTGYVKPGIKISGIFPYCDWNTGVKWEYGESLPTQGRFTIGSYISLSASY